MPARHRPHDHLYLSSIANALQAPSIKKYHYADEKASSKVVRWNDAEFTVLIDVL